MTSKVVRIVTGSASADADRYDNLQAAIDAAYDVHDGHIHLGPIDPETGYSRYYDVDAHN